MHGVENANTTLLQGYLQSYFSNARSYFQSDELTRVRTDITSFFRGVAGPDRYDQVSQYTFIGTAAGTSVSLPVVKLTEGEGERERETSILS